MFKDCLPTAIKDICRSQIVQRFVVTLMVVIIDELADLFFEFPRKVMIIQQDPVLQ
jgi:hypothetical protein